MANLESRLFISLERVFNSPVAPFAAAFFALASKFRIFALSEAEMSVLESSIEALFEMALYSGDSIPPFSFA